MFRPQPPPRGRPAFLTTLLPLSVLGLALISWVLGGSPLVALGGGSPSHAEPVAPVLGKGAELLAEAKASLARGEGPASLTREPCALTAATARPACPSGPGMSPTSSSISSSPASSPRSKNAGAAWTYVSTIAQPPNDENAPIAYDPTDGYVVAYEAQTYGATTWKYQNNNWSQIVTANSPGWLKAASMTWDATDGYAVLFGGYYGYGWTNETATFVHGTWTVLSFAKGPAPRGAASLTFDTATGYVLMFGGSDGTQNFGDTWKFQAGTWTPIGGAGPSARSGAAMAYDATDGYVLLYGGCTSLYQYGNTCYTVDGDTWMFQAGGWTQLSPATAPVARGWAGIAWDTPGGYLLLFAGCENGEASVNDTWEFLGGVWTALTIPHSPSARCMPSMTYDGGDGYVMVHDDWISTTNDTWAFGNPSIPVSLWAWANPYTGNEPLTVSFGSRVGGDATSYSYAWGFGDGSVGSAATAPTHVYNSTGVYTTHLTVTGSTGGSRTWWTNITVWRVASGYWTNDTANLSTVPTWRDEMGMVYDSSDGYVVLFGGLGPGGGTGCATNYLNDTWIFAGGQWSELNTPVAPSPRIVFGLADDPRDGYVVLFGGFVCTGSANDTWTFHAGVWRPLSITHAPPIAERPLLTDDPADGYLLYLGDAGDTWTFSGGTWTDVTSRTTGTLPSAVTSTGTQLQGTYDSTDGYVLLFSNGQSWSYHAYAWTNRTTAHFPTMQPGEGPADDPAIGGAVAFGAGPGLNQTWEYLAGTWEQVTVRSANPCGRIFAALAYDPSLLAPLLVEGEGQPGVGCYQLPIDTWIYNASAPFSAFATAAPSSGVAPLTVAFTGLVSGGTSPYHDLWSYGDGSPTSAAQDPTHTYNTTGRFPVTFTVTDTTGSSRTSHLNVTVSPPPPLSASISASPLSGTLPLTVAFTSTPSGGSSPYSYTWSFGDGGALSHAQDPSHVYNGTGTFLVQFTLADTAGSSVVRWTNITANAAPLQLTASGTPLTGQAPLLVAWMSSASGGVLPYRYSWNFGDGAPVSGAADPSHTYNATGTFHAVLTVLDQAGSSVNASFMVTVTAPGSPSPLSATATSNVTAGTAPLAVSFDGSAAGGSAPYTFTWDFGDSSPQAAGMQVNHTYTATGVFKAWMSVTDSAGHMAVRWLNITVSRGGGPITVVLTPLPASVVLGASTTLGAFASGGLGGYTFAWPTLPPGCTSSATANLPCTPTATGTFPAEVRVSDTHGDLAFGWTNVTVTPANGGNPGGGSGNSSGGFSLLGLGPTSSIIVLAVVLALVLGAIAAVLLARRRRGGPSAEAYPTEGSSPSSSGGYPGDPTPYGSQPPYAPEQVSYAGRPPGP